MKEMNNSQYIAEQLMQLRDLLIVIERGGESSPDILYKLAIEKSQKITSLVEQWREVVAPPAVELPTDYALWLDDKMPGDASEKTTEVIEDMHAIEPFEDAPETISVADEEDEYIAPFVEDTEVIETVEVDTQTETSQLLTDAEISEDSMEAPDDIAGTCVEDEIVEEDVADEDFEEVSIVTMDDCEYLEEEEEEDDDDETGCVEDDLVEREIYNRGEPLETEPAVVTVGEMLSVRRAKELRKALSLNDRFRFRRELFGNSDVNMNDTLNLLDTMSDLTEARDYLLQDLGWSSEEPVVQEFLALVERHFKELLK